MLEFRPQLFLCFLRDCMNMGGLSPWLGVKKICLPFRVLLDRAYSENNSAFCQLDSEMLSSQQHSSINQFANTSETNTSDRSFSKDLSQILVNIKSCRWRHFRPRTPSLHDSDNDELSYRKLHRSINRTGTAQPGTQTCSTSIQSKSSSGSAHFGMFILTNYILKMSLAMRIQFLFSSAICFSQRMMVFCYILACQTEIETNCI